MLTAVNIKIYSKTIIQNIHIHDHWLTNLNAFETHLKRVLNSFKHAPEIIGIRGFRQTFQLLKTNRALT